MLALATACLVQKPAMVYIEVVFDTDKTGHTIILQGLLSSHHTVAKVVTSPAIPNSARFTLHASLDSCFCLRTLHVQHAVRQKHCTALGQSRLEI